MGASAVNPVDIRQVALQTASPYASAGDPPGSVVASTSRSTRLTEPNIVSDELVSRTLNGVPRYSSISLLRSS